jgi:hypothetical protein
LRRRAPSIVIFVILMMLFDATRAWSTSEPDSFVGGLATSVRINWMLMVIAALAPYIVEAASFRPVPRAALSVLATFLLVAIPALFIALLYEEPVTLGVRDGYLLSNATFLVRSWWLYSVAGLLVAAYCHARDREVATIRAARTAELERACVQRNIVASRLQVLQARVEPELLFDALGDVRRAYLRDPEAAGSLLDDLIAYLRAALPQMRGGTSTLQREAALAEAYLKVVPAGRSGHLTVTVQVAHAVGAIPFPPMVLLPLAHGACEVSPEFVRIDAPATRGGTEIDENSFAVRVSTSHMPHGWEEAGLLAIRSALQNHFGAAAALQVERTDDAVSVVATWPAPDSLPLVTADHTVAPA